MPLLHILLSKIKQHHVSELGVTCWVGWVCVGGVPPLVLFLPNVRREGRIYPRIWTRGFPGGQKLSGPIANFIKNHFDAGAQQGSIFFNPCPVTV